MSKDPAFLFYPNDYIGGTMGMTFEEKGAYIELLMMQFNRGHMTSHMVGQTVGQLWDNIKDKFIQDDDGLWYNERLEEEKEKRQNYTKSRRNNMNGNNQHTKKTTQKVGHMTSHMENENENENKDVIVNDNVIEIEPTFEQFWNAYDKKRNRPKCLHLWRKLSQEDHEAIMLHVPAYVHYTPDKKYRKDPQTYLNQSGWEDEIIQTQKDERPITAKERAARIISNINS